jgi:MFS family permease
VWRLAVARLASQTGSSGAEVALVLLVRGRTDSSFLVGVVVGLTVAADAAASAVAGVAGDRFDRRRLMLLSDGAAAVVACAMAFAGPLPAVAAVAFLAVFVQAFFYPACNALVPSVVPAADLVWANSRLMQARLGGSVLGPALAGVAYAAFGPAAVFLGNAGTFAVSALLVSTLPNARTFRARCPAGPERERASLTAVLRANRVVGSMVAVWSIVQLGCGGLTVAYPALAAERSNAHSAYGLLIAVSSAGAFLGPALSTRLRGGRTLPPMLTALAVRCAALAAAALLRDFALVVVAVTVVRLAEGTFNSLAVSLIQRETPDRVRARVAAALDGASVGSFAVSLLYGGWVVDRVGYAGQFAVAAVSVAVAGLVLGRGLSGKGAVEGGAQ